MDPDGAAAAGMTTAMKIVSVGGTSTDGLTEAEASKLVAGKKAVQVKVEYDPASFATRDRGLELRRISLLG